MAPLLAKRPDVWPPASCGAATFEWACSMVQSRAFHLVKENWISMSKSEGVVLCLRGHAVESLSRLGAAAYACACCPLRTAYPCSF